MPAYPNERRSTDLQSPLASPDRAPFGFNVIGYVSGNLGLGVSARHLTSLLLDRGYPVAVLDLDPGMGRGRRDLRFDAYTVKSPNDLPYSINLAVLAVPSLPDFFLEPPLMLDSTESLQPGFTYWHAKHRLNVAVVWWELTVLPQVWVRALEAFDIVVAASPFVRSVLETHLSNVLIVPAIHPFGATEAVEACRARFGLPNDVIIFATGFEPLSDPERKNPFAAIDAFQRAFPGDSRVSLLIKLNNSDAIGRTMVPILIKLRERCMADPRIRIIEETLCYSDVLSLYASCDVFVSLHRSEGLGLGLMEAMNLGKPVIATAWSGNMAFMDHTNSCLVGYKLIPVQASAAHYSRTLLGEAGMWADPDLEQAAAWMRRLVEDPEARVALGHRAATAMVELEKEARKAKFVDELLAVWENGSFLPHRSSRERLDGLRAAFLQHQDSLRPYPERVARKLRAAADRYVLWRLR